jgi:alpha-ketoglutarate-dependent taurine dioxygenase
MPGHPTVLRPFDLADESAYRRWREWKLDRYPRSANDLVVQISNPLLPDAAERKEILARCRKANIAIYATGGRQTVDKDLIRRFAARFGLVRLDHNLRADEDSITSLRVQPVAGGTHYIPYTNRPLNWHTDGYYNPLDEQVRGIVMHCVCAAAAGGDNLFLDQEIAYILMRDENPDYIAALMRPDAMTIPPNTENGRVIRARQTGPVFSVEKRSGRLHMRYTARTRSIAWKDDRNTRLAVEFLAELLASDSDYIFRHRLQAGQGIICNNVLHRREAFSDDPGSSQERLLYRARFYDRIRDTEPECTGNGVAQCCG